MKPLDEARTLAESLVAIGTSAGLKTQAVITAMNWPIGFAVGNANEVIECIELLKGEGRPDLVENVLELSERMLIVAGVASDRTDAAARGPRALVWGGGLDRLGALTETQ